MIKRVLNKIRYLANARIHAPSVHIDRRIPTIRLGSKYGGWSFVDRPDLYNATILSCGLGEDATFDVEFAARYNAKVVLIDPTPRAIQHYRELSLSFGMPASDTYVAGGKQPVTAYDLSRLSEKNFTMISKALWSSNGNVRFYAPKNIDHVSHSIVNFQNEYSSETSYIEVGAITVDSLMAELGLDSLVLMKLDIEGAEGDVISDMLSKRIHPQQLLIEFDELGMPSRLAKAKYEATDRMLRQAGYELVDFDGHTNFLYVMFKS